MTKEELKEILREALVTSPQDFERDVVWEHIRKSDWDSFIQEIYDNHFQMTTGHIALAESMTACYLAGIQVGWLLAKNTNK